MIYRKDRYGNEISQLGYGCMRFTKKGAATDIQKAEREILKAIEGGVNYFDTAYIYPGSEECLGKILEKNGLRDKVYIATKLPQFSVKNIKQANKIFDEELKRLRTDRIDYYLMHMFTDLGEWERLREMGICDWIAERKKDGRIKNIGFSYHGEPESFIKITDAYDWDFCQIQYNYLDENSQAGKKGLMYAAEKGIPVIIMEPLRGGRLINIPDKAKKVFEENERHMTPAGWALSWLWDHKEITCVLSGMNSLEMVEENIKTASSAKAGDFDGSDKAVIEKVKGIIREKEKVNCTGCRYCMPCPKGVDIPGNFYYYNLMYMEKKYTARFEFVQNMGLRDESGFATQCIGCGLCEKHCPQHINIREKLKEADKALRPIHYKIGIKIAKKIFHS